MGLIQLVWPCLAPYNRREDFNIKIPKGGLGFWVLGSGFRVQGLHHLHQPSIGLSGFKSFSQGPLKHADAGRAVSSLSPKQAYNYLSYSCLTHTSNTDVTSHDSPSDIVWA